MNFNNMVDDFVRREPRERKPNTLYCSELGYCKRMTFFNTKYPKEFGPDTLKIFLLGDVMHDKMTEILKRSNEIKYVESEVPMTIYIPGSGLRLSGRCDDIIHMENGTSYMVEKKSCSSLVPYVKNNEPSEHHKIQLMAYLAASGIHEGFLLYMNKKNFNTKAFKIDFDQKYFDKEMARAEDIINCINNDIVPEAEAKINKGMEWQCRYACNHCSTCKKLGNDPCDYKEEEYEGNNK